MIKFSTAKYPTTISIFLDLYLSSVDIVKLSAIYDPFSTSSLKYLHLFRKKESSPGTDEKLNFISSIWDHRLGLTRTYSDLVRITVFYLFCWRSTRILVTAVFVTRYIYTQSSMIIIYRRTIGYYFSEITLAHLYTYIYINILIYNGNLFSWSCLFSANIR